MPAPAVIPAEPNERWWMAVNVPSFFAPMLTVMSADGREGGEDNDADIYQKDI